jgi:hypothetical protein
VVAFFLGLTLGCSQEADSNSSDWGVVATDNSESVTIGFWVGVDCGSFHSTATEIVDGSVHIEVRLRDSTSLRGCTDVSVWETTRLELPGGFDRTALVGCDLSGDSLLRTEGGATRSSCGELVAQP